MDQNRLQQIRAKFQIPDDYVYWRESYGEVCFTFCDSTIEVDLRAGTAKESHMAYGDEGHYFTPWCKWPGEGV